ncbi:MAG: proline--tRNA ligase [Candidatus Omnitrophica bacterium]|nr:proline--tRNA ligase [Candidatus Omnitrophota bacterium]MDD5430253.1 proline--tRNA ligase [Candidatus Omnitrophota bacterium]
MLFSESFIFTLRQDPKTAECRSHQLLLKAGFIHMVSSGIYSYLPLAWRVLSNVNNIIRKHMNSSGGQEILMSALQPLEMWQKTGRDKDLAEIMFTFKDRKQRQLCLGPTHEEAVTDIAKRFVSSYKQLPFILYQIQTKFRDEPRARFGLMRSCEFLMKDAYSFDIDQKGLDASYEKMFSAYKAIFKECGLDFVISEADPGAMGGTISHEFMVGADIGEDLLFCCQGCGKFFKDKGSCPDCGRLLEDKKMIEVGHIFKLGTKYSLVQEAYYLDNKGIRKPIVMGCYGIGISRVISAVAEVSSDEKGLIWPSSISPFDVSLIMLDESLRAGALDLKDKLECKGLSVLVDDRNESAGVKFKDAYLIGNPYIVIMGKKYISECTVDLENRKTGEKKSFQPEELLRFIPDK